MFFISVSSKMPRIKKYLQVPETHILKRDSRSLIGNAIGLRTWFPSQCYQFLLLQGPRLKRGWRVNLLKKNLKVCVPTHPKPFNQKLWVDCRNKFLLVVLKVPMLRKTQLSASGGCRWQWCWPPSLCFHLSPLSLRTALEASKAEAFKWERGWRKEELVDHNPLVPL